MVVPQTEVVIRKDGSVLGVHVIRPGDYVIGSGDLADLCIKGAEHVAAEHARLVVNYNEMFVEDLGSGQGTRISGQPVSENTRLWPGQTLQIGEVMLELQRLKPATAMDSLAPQAAQVQKLLPEDIRGRRKYDIGGVVAQGGMGAILEAREVPLRRKVAMKLLIDDGVSDQIARFVEEAQITGQLEHPSIVPVYELGVNENDQPFYTMKFVRGLSLGKVITMLAREDAGAVKRYPLSALLVIFQKACDGLAFAHSKSVIHRDLKPENIMLGEYGEVLVMDWGLAKVMDRVDQCRTADETLRTMIHSIRQEQPTSASTMAGTVLGTPHYMSPEQAGGEIEKLDPRTDIYSLGAILYTILTLTPPVRGTDPDEVVAKVRAGHITPPVDRVGSRLLPHLPGGLVPEPIAEVTMQALAADREERFSTVKSFQAALTAAIDEAVACSPARRGARAGGSRAFSGRRWLALGAWTALVVAITAASVIFGGHKQEAIGALDSYDEALSSAREREAALTESMRAASAAEVATAAEYLRTEPRWREGLARLVRALEWDPENELAAARLFQTLAANGRARRDWPVFLLEHRDGVKQAVFSPDGAKILTACVDGSARLWDAQTGAPLFEPLRHSAAVSCCAFSPDGSLAATGSGDGTVRIWSVASGEALGQPLRHGGWVQFVAFSPDGARLATTGSNHTARLWDVSLTSPIGEPMRHAGLVHSAVFNADGTKLVTASADTTASLWEAATGKPIIEPLAHAADVTYAEFNRDGTRVVTASEDGSARLWDTATGAPVGAPLRMGNPVVSAHFSPVDDRVLTAGAAARLWDSTKGEAIGAPFETGWPLAAAIFSPHGDVLAADDRNGTICLWTAETRAPLGETCRHRGLINSIVFSPNGRLLLSASADRTVALWARPDSKRNETFPVRGTVYKSTGPLPSGIREFATAVAGVSFGADGRLERVETPARLETIRRGLPDDPGWSELASWIAKP